MTGEPVTDGRLPAAVEGVLIAHRRLIEVLLVRMAGEGPDAIGKIDEIERRLGYDDYHEDPGVDPDPAFAIERAADAELRRLLREVRAVLASDPDASGR